MILSFTIFVLHVNNTRLLYVPDMKFSLHFHGNEVKVSTDRLKSKSLEHIDLHESDNSFVSLPSQCQ
jgi:hypothetical protein